MRIALALLAGAAILSCGAPTVARVQLDPTVELRQVVARSGFDDDTVTYSEAVAGVNGSISTRRVKATLNYQYGRRFGNTGNLGREQRHNLFSRADVELIDNRLSLRAGGFAALLNRDLRGQVSVSPDQNNPNLVQTFSVYVEPTYHQPLRGIGDLDLTYRVGYFNVADGNSSSQQLAGGIPGGAPVDIGTDQVSPSINQTITANLGNRETRGRFRWDVTGTATLEDMDRLSQTYRAYDARIEGEYVVQRGIGLIANVGYQHFRNTQADVLRDPTGTPIPGADGDFQLDPTAPRRVLYAQDGLSYEGGVRLQPTRRALVNVRVGRRFGNLTVNGDARYEYSPRLVFSARYVDSIDSFGRLLTQDLDGIRVQQVIQTSQTIGLSGCVFGTDPGGGGCLFNASQSITNATFRNRAGQFIAEAKHGRLNAMLGVVYNRREFLDTEALQAPGTPLLDASITGRADETITLDARLQRALRNGQGMGIGVFASRYRYALSSDRNDRYFGGNANYSVALGRRLAGTLNALVARRVSSSVASTTEYTASGGLSYRF